MGQNRAVAVDGTVFIEYLLLPLLSTRDGEYGIML